VRAADPIVGDELLEHLAGEDALRAMGVEQVVDLAAELREFGLEPPFHLLGRTDRRSGFQDDQIAGGDERSDRAGSGFDEREIRYAGAVGRGQERRRDGEDEDVGRRGQRRGLEIAGLHRGAHEHVEIRFLDMDAAAIDRVDHRRGDVDAEHAAAFRREDGRGREADVAEAEDAEGGHFSLGGRLARGHVGKGDTRVSNMEY